MYGQGIPQVLHGGLLLGTALAIISLCDAVAQEVDEQTVLEPIIVTARQIEETTQHIPFAITAVSGEELRHAGANDTQSLARRVPNFNHADSGLSFSNLVNMRGIGSSSALISPSVNYYIDGVPIPARVFDTPFGDVERVEVLRGPQGTHFGLNSQAGAVSIITRDPGDTFGGSAGIILGSHGQKEADVSLEGPLTEAVSGRISGRIHDFDGDLTNILWSAPGVVSSSQEYLRSRLYGTLSGKLLIDQDDAGRLTLGGGWSRGKQNPTTGVWLDDPGFPRNAFNPLPELKSETANFTAKYERDLDWARFTSITGFQYYTTALEADIVDGFLGSAQTGVSGYYLQAPGGNVRRINEDNSQFSQEFRFDGETEKGTRWVGGISALRSDFDSTTDVTSAAMANGNYSARINTTNFAAFGEVTAPITERLNWIGGLRLTHEIKDFEGLFLGRRGALAEFGESGEEDYTFLTGRTGLTFDLANDLTAFATIARGEKTGGYLFYNQLASFGIPLKPYWSSKTWSYELGLKAADSQGWLDFSASVFYNDTKDEQLFTYNPSLGRFSVQNAGTHSYGAELETVIRPTDTLSLGANIALLNAEITGGNALIEGNDVPYAPSFSGMLHAEYNRDLDILDQAGSAYFRTEYSYTGSRQIDAANSRRLDGYSLVNVRAGWRGESWELFGAVENVFDEDYVTSAYLAGTNTSGQSLFAGIPGVGRIFSICARVKF